jgi:hypothetical protein
MIIKTKEALKENYVGQLENFANYIKTNYPFINFYESRYAFINSKIHDSENEEEG